MRSNTLDEVQPLLQALLAHLLRARATPLQFGIDSERIVSAALQECLGDAAGSTEAGERDWKSVTTVLDDLVTEVLQPARPPCGRVNPGFGASLQQPVATNLSSGDCGIKASHPFADWLDRFHAVMCERHPRAAEIVAMKVEGFEDRDVAERLKLGLRLVKQVAEDLHLDWLRATKRE